MEVTTIAIPNNPIMTNIEQFKALLVEFDYLPSEDDTCYQQGTFLQFRFTSDSVLWETKGKDGWLSGTKAFYADLQVHTNSEGAKLEGFVDYRFPTPFKHITNFTRNPGKR